MSSLASPQTVPALEIGQTLTGAKGRYLLTKHITQGVHRSTVFKAEVLSGDETLLQAKWVLIKTASPNDEKAKISLKREYDVYCKSSITTSPDIRAMYDVVGDFQNLDSDTSATFPYLVLEWMDFTLEEVPSKDYRQNYVFLKAFVKAGLSSLVVLLKEGLMNTDLKPDNILVSKLNTSDPVVKIGDLGLTYPDGSQKTVQPFAMRAPEVYQGLGCYHGSTVWALFATLVCWIKPGVLGASGSPNHMYHAGWSMGKLMRLFPDWNSPPDDDKIRQAEFNFARALSSDPDGEKLISVSTLENEMQTMGIPPELKNLLRRVLVVDPNARPSAAEALKLKEYLALEEAASRSQRST